MPNNPFCHPMTSHKITQDGRVGGKKNGTVHNLCFSPFEHMLVQRR